MMNSPVNLLPLLPASPLSHLLPVCAVAGGSFTPALGFSTSSAPLPVSAFFLALALAFLAPLPLLLPALACLAVLLASASPPPCTVITWAGAAALVATV